DEKKQAGKGKGEPPQPPEPPVLKRLVCSDTTVEKLAELLEDNPRGILLARDELAGWLTSFTRYKSKQGVTALPNWPEMFQAGTIVVDRKTGNRTTLFVHNAAVSITGGIQPHVLAKGLTPEFMDAGGAARLLMAMPTKIKKRWTDAEVPREVEDAYHQVLDKLIQLDLDHDEDGECRPYMLDLAEDAKKLWVAFYNSWAAEQANAEGELAAAYSKLEGYAARLALIHHVVSHVFLDASDLRLVGTKSIEAGI